MAHGQSEAAERIVGFAISPDKVCSIQYMRDRLTQCCWSEINVCCLTQAKKHLKPELLTRAAAANITIRAIDPLKPVTEQGPFDLILQKCRDEGMLQIRTLHVALQAAKSKTFIIPPSGQTAHYAPG